ncbi:MAG: hypothetical protein H8D23_35025, partial [Candidatus Brocadiales bacterium]|nr:hypothetical protein [Candidatus Brocadiales bacterium]
MNNKQIPQAPTPKKLKWKRRVIITGIVIAVIAILIFLLDNWALNKIENNSSQPKQTSQLEASLRYLNDIPEITWIDFDDNTVYIGFNPIPDDL